MQATQKPLYCHYIGGETDDFGEEGLVLYLPTIQGYIQYTLVHSVNEKRNCNVWRLGPAYHCDDAGENSVPLTRPLSEWEMAIKLQERPDFIGGAVHGDELLQSLHVTLDGAAIEPAALSSKTAFHTLTATILSVGYDPSAPAERVLLHRKEITFDRNGVCVVQRVEWLCDRPLAYSYMAMMPPLKTYTQHYHTDLSPAARPIPRESLTVTERAKTLCLTGDDGFSFSMTVEKYLSEGEDNTYSITDNGGNSYNKMYFSISHGDVAKKGDVWETATLYSIQKSKKPAP